MIMVKRLVSLLNSSRSGNFSELESKEIWDFIDKYSTRADPDPKDKIINKETEDWSHVLEPKSVKASPQSPNLMCQ